MEYTSADKANRGFFQRFFRPENIVAIGIVLLLSVFPLIVHDRYIDILNIKYLFFYVCVIAMAVIALLAYGFQIRYGENKTVVRWKLRGPDYAVLALVLAYIAATLQSEYVYESFWGNEGRFCGLFLMFIYGLLYFIVTRFFQFKKIYVDIFLLSSILVCLWGVTDFFNLDIFHFRTGLREGIRYIFTSSIGNINTYTSYVALFMGISAVLFISAESKKQAIWYGVCLAFSFLAIVTGMSDNAYLALAALFAFVPYYAFISRQGLCRYVCMIALFFSVVQVIAWISLLFQGKTVEINSLFKIIAGLPAFILLVLFLWFAFFLTACLNRRGERKGNTYSAKKAKQIWSIILLLSLAVLLALLYDANTAENPEKYGALSKYLVFNDEWGTHRLFNWKLAVKNYINFPLHHKLFGYGAETYGILTLQNNLAEMVAMFNEKYENAHNEYLHYLVTIGAFGLISYVSVLISTGVSMVKQMGKNPYVMALFYAVICYGVQASVNIATPIVTPYIWIFISMGMAACYQKENLQEN